jgi:hypothetical protein
MKRLLLSFIVASGLALMAAAPAGAVAGACGKSYAFQVNGDQPTFISQDGSSTLPGALTQSVGVGVITFNAAGTNGTNGCTISGGEMVYNSGDVQSNPQGELFGSNSCFEGDSFLSITQGIPCFDGTNRITGSLTAPGADGGGSWDLSFTMTADYVDGAIIPGTPFPFSFTLQPAAGSATVLGTSKSDHGAGVAHILGITLQKIATTNPLTNQAAYGNAPYVGLVSLLCTGTGANLSDGISNNLNAQTGGIAGSFGTTLGSLQIFDATHAGGALSFDGNDDLSATGFTGTASNNDDCSFISVADTQLNTITPNPGCNPDCYDQNLPTKGIFAFADGASNTTAETSDSGLHCSYFTSAGFIFSTSNVQWGSTNQDSYNMLTGIASTVSTGGQFLPPVVMNTCTILANSPAGKLTTTATASVALKSPAAGGAATKTLFVTNTSPADCHVTFALSGTLSNSDCALSINGGSSANYDALGDSPSTLAATVSCTCASDIDTFACSGGTKNGTKCKGTTDTTTCVGGGTCVETSPTDDAALSATLTASSVQCPIAAGAGPVTYTCVQP